MKKFNTHAVTALVSFMFMVSPMAVLAFASPATVNLGEAGNFEVLAKTGISTTGTTSIVGDIGVSPAEATYITGFGLTLPYASPFSTSALIIGKVYAPGYANPTPANLTVAVLDMQTAYTDAMGRAADVTELGAGNIGGLTLAPGVYKWGTGVTIPTNVTLSGSANDVWIFQITQNLNISSATNIVLSGGAQASNIFWVVAGQTTIGTTALFNGNILDQTAIVINTGAILNGRALAQTAVTLDANSLIIPTSVVVAPSPSPTPSPTTSTTPTPTPTPNPVACTMEAMQCPDGSYVSRQGPMCAFTACPGSTSQTQTTSLSNASIISLQAQLVSLLGRVQSLQAQVLARQGNVSTGTVDSSFGQSVRTIVTNLVQGSRNNNVTILQQFLISQNKGSSAQALGRVGATGSFGALTRSALAEFQASVGISPASGNFGAKTRGYISAH